MTNQIVLGSGALYVMPYVAETGIPTDALIEVAANQMGLIKGGASVEYKPTEYEIFDDSYAVHQRFITSEEVSFKSGILTWNVETLKNLIAKGEYTDDTTGKTRTLKLGGKSARKMDEYIVRFVHTYSDGINALRITLVGTASNGFSLAFSPDKETVIDAEFKAKAHDADGVQLIIEDGYSEGVFYTITNTLDEGVVNSNLLTSIMKGADYSATISAIEGYEVDTVTVTMGVTDVTSTAYTAATGAITIPAVTGNLVITATEVA